MSLRRNPRITDPRRSDSINFGKPVDRFRRLSYGELTVITGPMFSGKSKRLINMVHSNNKLGWKSVIKSAFDTRYSPSKIMSHDGLSVEAQAIEKWEDNYSKAIDIYIDEIQFFEEPHFTGNIVNIIKNCLASGQDVTVCGLDMDTNGKPFPITACLLAMADFSIKLKSNCHVCGNEASKTIKKVSNGNQIELGSDDLYEARCNRHFLIYQGLEN